MLAVVGAAMRRARPYGRPRGAFGLALIAAVVALLVWLPSAHAQPQPKPKVVPPKVEQVSDPPYPEGAKGDAEVILVLVINADGTVRSAEVQTGDEPFASAAREAAGGWRFLPATRDEKPIAAKIRYRVSFIEEQVQTPPPQPGAAPQPGSDGQPSQSDSAAAAGAEQTGVTPQPDGPAGGNDGQELYEPPEPPPLGLIDVDVRGQWDRHPPSVSSLKRAEVRQLPGAFGDPFRAIEVLPGVTPIASGLPFFYVRGAPPGNIGYFLDGVRVPYLFHVAAGPSVVHPAIVERVDLHAGGYPARFGRFSGAIVSAEATKPRADWHGEGVIRLVDAGALVEGGFAEGRGTALLGGRYSYTAGLFSLISPEITLDYRDFQARVSYDITDRDRVSLFSFGAYDYLSQTEEVPGEEEDAETVLFGSEFYRVDGRYDRRLARGGRMRAAVTFGFDQTRLFGTRNSQNYVVRSRMRLTQPINKQLTVRGGFDMRIDNYVADRLPYSDPDNPSVGFFNDLFPARADTGVAAWVDAIYKPSEKFEITPGVRVDSYYSAGAKAIAVDPRLAMVVKPRPNIRILHSIGIANQPPSFVVPVPGLAVASLNDGLQTSLQASSGVEIGLPEKITASISAYTGVYLNMTDSIGSQQAPTDESIPRSLGSSKGIEIYIRRSLTERLGGFVSYTFSRTTRSVGRERFLATFDRPHVLHSAFGYKLGSGWQTGLRFSLYSGAVVAPEPGNESDDASERVRDPVFYRFDFRVEKKWSIFDRAWISFVMEMINATLNQEIIAGGRIGPVTIPSIGVEGGF